MSEELENFNVTVKQLKYLHDIIDDLKNKLNKSNAELEWYRTYSSFINTNFSNVCAEASAYADGDLEDDQDRLEKGII